MSIRDLSTVYDEFYYAHYTTDGGTYERSPGWLQFFGGMAQRIDVRLRPGKTLDAGCAYGYLVEALRDRGIEAFGIDHSEYAIQQARPDIRQYCRVGSITEPFAERYDLITCIEVLEHLPAREGEGAIENLCAHTDDIIFSSTPYHYDDATHLNVRPPDYWAELFAAHGFYRDVDFDPGFIISWAARFRRTGEPPARALVAYERRLWQLEKENEGLHKIGLEQQQQLAACNAALLNEAGLRERTAALERQLHEREHALQSELQQADRRLQAANGDLARVNRDLQLITGSRGWRMLQALWAVRRKLLPKGNPPTASLSPGLSKSEPEPALLPQPELQAPPVSYNAVSTIELAPTPPLAPHGQSADVIICIRHAQAEVRGRTLEAVRTRLETVVRETRMPYTLTLIDDGNDTETRAYLADFAVAQGAVLLHNEQSPSFAKTVNQGLRHATAEYVVLLTGDTIVTRGWLDRLIACAESDRRIGVAAPLSNAGLGLPNEAAPTPAETGKLIADYAGRLFPSAPFVAAPACLIKREVIEAVGHFAEEAESEARAMVDYCRRARQAGFEVVWADDAYVHQLQISDVGFQADHDETDDDARVRHGIRARAQRLAAQAAMEQRGKEKWEGKRVLFVLPLAEQGNEGDVVVQTAYAMERMGVDVRLVNDVRFAAAFADAYPDLTLPVIYRERRAATLDLPVGFDALIAGNEAGAQWLKVTGDAQAVRGCLVQGTTLHVYPPAESDDAEILCRRIGPHVDLDLFRPRPRRPADSRVRIAVAVRSDISAWEAEAMRQVWQTILPAHGNRVEVLFFSGSAHAPWPLAEQIPQRRFHLRTRAQRAALLNEADVYLDFAPAWPTVLEAMACGATVIVSPATASDFVRHEINGLIVEIGAVEGYRQALTRLIFDEQFRLRLSRCAAADACRYPAAAAACRLLQAVFPTAP